MTVLKRTTSAGSCGPVVTERPASVIEQVKGEEEPTCDEKPLDDVDDSEQKPTSPPPTDSTAALKFCSKRSVNYSAYDTVWSPVVECNVQSCLKPVRRNLLVSEELQVKQIAVVHKEICYRE